MTPIRIALIALVFGVLAVDVVHQGSQLYRCRAERVGLAGEIDLLRRERQSLRTATQQRLMAAFIDRPPPSELVRLSPPASSNPWSSVEKVTANPRQAFATDAPEERFSPSLRVWLRGR